MSGRRAVLTSLLMGTALVARLLAETPAQNARVIAAGPFKPTWESLSSQYRSPDWFRDAKFGIWAHWSAQCVPEQGDWYARGMYQQGSKQYEYHLKTYGHPSTFGFMEIDNLWKAERWDPERLMALYKRAGAKYFVALANHHDNFDAYDSRYHAWNSVNVGPKKDIVGTWARVARANGLRFGVSNHSAHAWHWFQTAYGYDGEGPLAGTRYDAATLTKADGKGKWWDGLDPQELYTGPNMKLPDGIVSAKAVDTWHQEHDRKWTEEPPAVNPAFTERWFLRAQDLLDHYQPDLVYWDNTELPLGQTGLDIVAHYYNANLAAHGGRLEAVVNAKKMQPEHRAAVVEDIERGQSDVLRPEPWQTDTCIGSWHYSREIAESRKYKTVGQVVDMLVDIVSKNGNLLLSIPVRGDGTLDEQELAFLDGLAKWMDVNAEGIFGTRPFAVFGEGPTQVKAGMFAEKDAKPFTGEDVRFTTKGQVLYAFLLAWPAEPRVSIRTLAATSPQLAGKRIASVSLLGHAGRLDWTHTPSALDVTLPAQAPSEHAVALKIELR